MTHAYPPNVFDAANLLDKVKPGWFEKINVDRLDMSNETLCILGQLYGTYLRGMGQLFGVHDYSRGADRVFGTIALSTNWKNEISKRKLISQGAELVKPKRKQTKKKKDVKELTKEEGKILLDSLRKTHVRGHEDLKLKLYEFIYG